MFFFIIILSMSVVLAAKESSKRKSESLRLVLDTLLELVSEGGLGSLADDGVGAHGIIVLAVELLHAALAVELVVGVVVVHVRAHSGLFPVHVGGGAVVAAA